jgi:hypothetical protein
MDIPDFMPGLQKRASFIPFQGDGLAKNMSIDVKPDAYVVGSSFIK